MDLGPTLIQYDLNLITSAKSLFPNKVIISVRVLKRNRAKRMYRHIQLWRLTSLKMCSQQAGVLGELMVRSSLSPKV